jgi:hypothetical protein
MKLSSLTEAIDPENALQFSDFITDHVSEDKIKGCVKAYRELALLGFKYTPEITDQNPCFINESDYMEAFVIYLSRDGRTFWVDCDNGYDSFRWGRSGSNIGNILHMNSFGDIDWTAAINAVNELYTKLDKVDELLLHSRAQIRQQDK